MQQIGFKLTILYSLLLCGLFAGCSADEGDQTSGIASATAEGDGKHEHAVAGREASKPMHERDEDAGLGSSPSQPSAAAGSGVGDGGARAATPAHSPNVPASSSGGSGSGGSNGNGGSAAAAGSGGTGGAAANAQPASNAPVIPSSMSTASTAADGDIDTVMMDVAYVLGATGNLDPEPRPIIMFKDGWACRDINFVVKNLSVAEHKAMFPDTWVQWKVVDGKVALQKGSDWTKMYFQLKYPPNTSSLTFDKVFTFSHVATLANTTMFTKQSIRFMSDHSVVLGNEPADSSHRGTYKIDGYTIELKWESGSTTRTSFVWSNQDAPAIYIGGDAYLTRN